MVEGSEPSPGSGAVGPTVTVDPDRCVGSATCVGIAPELFELRDGVAHGGPVPPDAVDEAQDAVDACPVQAISLVGTSRDPGRS